MITISTGKNIAQKYKDYIDDCVNAMFCGYHDNYDIHVNIKKFIDADHSPCRILLGRHRGVSH